MIKINHNAGFFSCCSVKLDSIVNFVNHNNKLPFVDSSYQFRKYKKKLNEDITYDFFKHYDDIENIRINKNIKYSHKHQFNKYSNLDYYSISPLIEKYFSVSNKINEIVDYFVEKYDLVYDNTLVVYYRGTDKSKETDIASFDEFYKQIINIISSNDNLKILVQTDTAQLIDYLNDKELKNITISENKTSYHKKGIHNENNGESNYNQMLNFLSTVIIMSRCKYIICGSCNCSMWIMFYRKSSKNVIQYLNKVWYNYID